MKPIWTILITVVATAAIAGSGTWYLVNKSADKDKSDLQAQIDDLSAIVSGTTVASGDAVTSGMTVADETAGWKTYTNTEVGFTLKYPKEWSSMKLNLINNLKDGYGGKFISSSDGKNGIVHFDPDQSFDISAQAKAYVQGPPVFNTSYSQVKVDTSWSAADLQKNMFGAQAMPEVLMVKKLSDKSLLVYDYFNNECSPGGSLKVITALNSEFPNLEISITSSSAAVTADFAAARTALKEDQCDAEGSSRQIAEKIKNGDYPDLSAKIETARLIADSLAYDETLTWKTYTNTTYGLAFRYPTEWTLDKKPMEIDSGSVLSVSYSTTEALFKVSVFSSVQNLPKLEDPAGNSNATSLANYFASQNMTSSAVKVGIYDGFDVNHSDIGGSNYYYIENLGKVYVFRIDARIKESADKIFSTLQLTK